MIRFATKFAVSALIGAIGAVAAGQDVKAAEQRYEMEACGGAKPCVFVLDTESGEMRYCDTAGCRVLDAVAPAERPSPFPLPGQGAVTSQTIQPMPLGDIGIPEPSARNQLNSPPAAGGGPSPFPYVEPAPRGQ